MGSLLFIGCKNPDSTKAVVTDTIIKKEHK